MKRRNFFAAAAALPFVGKMVKAKAAMPLPIHVPRFWLPIPPGMVIPSLSPVGRLEQLMSLHEHGMIDDETFRRLAS